MSESPYAVPEDELVSSARVPVAEQVAEHPERRYGGDAVGGTSIVGDADCGDGGG